MVTPAAWMVIWFLNYIPTHGLCSSRNFFLECLALWSSHSISCHSGVSFNVTSSKRIALSLPSMGTLSSTFPSFKSLHSTHPYCWYLFTILSPLLWCELKWSQNLLLSNSLLHPWWLESHSIKKWMNEKTHTCASDKNELTGNALCNYLQKQKRFLYYNLLLDGYRIKTMWILGNKQWGLQSWFHEASKWTEILISFLVSVFLAECSYILPSILDLPKNVKETNIHIWQAFCYYKNDSYFPIFVLM